MGLPHRNLQSLTWQLQLPPVGLQLKSFPKPDALNKDILFCPQD